MIPTVLLCKNLSHTSISKGHCIIQNAKGFLGFFPAPAHQAPDNHILGHEKAMGQHVHFA